MSRQVTAVLKLLDVLRCKGKMLVVSDDGRTLTDFGVRLLGGMSHELNALFGSEEVVNGKLVKLVLAKDKPLAVFTYTGDAWADRTMIRDLALHVPRVSAICPSEKFLWDLFNVWDKGNVGGLVTMYAQSTQEALDRLVESKNATSEDDILNMFNCLVFVDKYGSVREIYNIFRNGEDRLEKESMNLDI